MTPTRSELLFFRCPTCAHRAHWSRRLVRAPAAGVPAPYVCGRCGEHAVPQNFVWIALASLVFFAVAAAGLALLARAMPFERENAFFLAVILSVAFFQLLARRLLTWRSVSIPDAG
ncbi:MAG TPA: hypothetical protein VL742_00100 [Casimicrobiaceae bacterium]|nr:hypothetical protein [Casimicrobiaceae bacterium]